MDIRVECYAGYRGEETPRRIWMGDKKIEVKEVLDRWLSPDHRYFKFIGGDDSLYIIRHDMETYRWELTFYKKNASGGGVFFMMEFFTSLVCFDKSIKWLISFWDIYSAA